MLHLKPSRTTLLSAALVLLTCVCGLAQDQGQQPATATPAPAARLVLSASTFAGGTQYQSWPLVLELTLWREPVGEGTESAPPPLVIKAKEGAWCEALVVTVKDGEGTVAQWPLHLVTQQDAQLSLTADDAASVEWWLTPEETKTLAEGDYTLSVAFDPQRVEGLPTGAEAPRADACMLHVTAEPAQLDAETAADKLYQLGWYCMVREDRAGADANLAKLRAADPQSIGARRLQAMLLARDGKVAEGLAQISEAIGIYWTKHPKACPPLGLLALQRELRAQMPALTTLP